MEGVLWDVRSNFFHEEVKVISILFILFDEGLKTFFFDLIEHILIFFLQCLYFILKQINFFIEFFDFSFELLFFFLEWFLYLFFSFLKDV